MQFAKIVRGELAAIDGSFFRGNVVKESIFTQARLKKHLKLSTPTSRRICRNWRRSMPQGRAGADAGTVDLQTGRTQDPASALQDRVGATETSQRNPKFQSRSDARLLTKSGQSVAGYNVQIATDAKHKLMVHYGSAAEFRAGLTQRGLRWSVGVQATQKVYPADVELSMQANLGLGDLPNIRDLRHRACRWCR